MAETPGHLAPELWAALPALEPAPLVFRIDRSRGGSAIDALLRSELDGVVGADRLSAYNQFPAERRALRWAHLKRDF